MLQALQNHLFKEALQLLNSQDRLEATVAEYLKRIYIPSFVVKTYSKIDRRALIDMLSLQSEQELADVIGNNFIIEGQ